jgi:hypothetical protein
MNCKIYKHGKAAITMIAFTLLLVACTCRDLYAQGTGPAKINVGLIYPLSTNWTNAPKDSNTFSLNLIAGVSRSEKGISLAGFSNIVRENAGGLQLAGFSNHIGNNAKGSMIAGFLNTYGNGKGTAVAGFANVAHKSSGVQISGFLNVAKTVKGIQLSFLNIADTADLQIGVINLSKNGEKSFGLTIDENQTMMLTFRSGGKWLYGILGTGYNLHNNKAKYAYETGLGLHLYTAKSFRLSTEIVAGGLNSFKKGDYLKASARLLPALKLSHWVELFGGPSLNFVYTNSPEGINLTKNRISSWYSDNNRRLDALTLGYTAGMQVSF